MYLRWCSLYLRGAHHEVQAHVSPADDPKEAYIRRRLEAASDANRPVIARFLKAKRAEAVKLNTLINLTVHLTNLDAAIAGRSFHEVPAQCEACPPAGRCCLTDALVRVTRTASPSTAKSFAGQVKALYRWLHDGELPPRVRKAMKRKPQLEFGDVEVIRIEERDALLASADTGDPVAAARFQALLWILWDAGFRISEALSLRVRDVRPDDQGGAYLRLPPPSDTPLELKTGPRAVYVVQCLGAVNVWLAVHPGRDDLDAFLFPCSATLYAPVKPTAVNKWMAELCERSTKKHRSPHDWRHSAATRDAENGWNEAQLRAKYGWSKNSRMPAHYVHLSQRNVEERVRADAAVDSIGAAIRPDPKRALADAVAQAVNMTAPTAVAETLRQLRAAAAADVTNRSPARPLLDV